MSAERKCICVGTGLHRTRDMTCPVHGEAAVTGKGAPGAKRFHTHSGWWFTLMPNGDVVVSDSVVGVTLDRDTWSSVVREMELPEVDMREELWCVCGHPERQHMVHGERACANPSCDCAVFRTWEPA